MGSGPWQNAGLQVSMPYKRGKHNWGQKWPWPIHGHLACHLITTTSYSTSSQRAEIYSYLSYSLGFPQLLNIDNKHKAHVY